ncbi:MAG: hypothetical protein K8F91_09695, partial [Candidatus Obscuribacterales bacterium]|nr:hypothetical protein [Candidatus Obscuribacterales bacterium]
MDADLPRIPEKQVLIAKSDRYVDEDIKKINEMIRARKARGGLTVSYGPIAAMDLGPGWEDLGVIVIGGRPVRQGYENKSLDCALSVNFKADNHKSDSAFLQNLTQTTGPVPKSDWHNLRYLFDEAGNSKLFIVHSVDIAELGSKNVVVMTGQHTSGNLTRAKHVYVSLSGDWK